MTTPMMIRTNTAMDTPTAIGMIALSVPDANGPGVDGRIGWSVLDV